MWYVKLNDNVLPTPYQYFHDCMEECRRLSEEMCAVRTEPVIFHKKGKNVIQIYKRSKGNSHH